MHPGQKLKPGARVVFEGVHTLHGEILERRFFGRRLIRLWTEDGRSGRRRRRRDRPRAAAAVHQARRPRGRPRSLPDRLRARARIDRGADRRPALHPGPARGPDARAASRRPRSPSTSATARFSRCASTASRIIASNRSATRSARRPRRPSTARAPRTAASSRSARRRRGRSRRWRWRTAGGSWPAHGATDLFIYPGFHVPRHRRPADQLPPAAVVAADAGVGVCRPRARAGRVSRGDRRALPVLQLRRRDARTLTLAELGDLASLRALSSADSSNS